MALRGHLMLAALFCLAAGAAGVGVWLMQHGEPASGGTPAATSRQFRPDKTTVAGCKNSDVKCVAQGYGNIAYTQGAGAAMQLVQASTMQQETNAGACHEATHVIGRASVARAKGDIAAVLSNPVPWSSMCRNGYFHGVLSALTYNLDRKAIGDLAASCLRKNQDDTCAHGLGHGLGIYTNFDLRRAIRMCDQLSPPGRSSPCYGGAFMEVLPPIADKPDDWWYPCGELEVRMQTACYGRVGVRVIQRHGQDWTTMLHQCKAAGGAQGFDNRTAQICSAALSRWLGMNTVSVEKIKGVCAQMESLERRCLRESMFSHTTAHFSSCRTVMGQAQKISCSHRIYEALASVLRGKELHAACMSQLRQICAESEAAAARRI